MTLMGVVGAGPVGMMVARELQLQGVPSVVFEAATERSPFSKALGIHSRTIEILKMRGIADVMLRDGLRMPRHHFAMLESSIDYTTLPGPYPFLLAYPQVGTENTLEAAALAAGAELRRGHRITALRQNSESVDVDVVGPDGDYTETVDYLVGCDGGRSIVRESCGIDFPGSEVTGWWFLGEVHLDEPPRPGFALHSEAGAVFAAPIPGGLYRVSGIDLARQDRLYGPMAFEDFRQSVIRTAGSDFGMHDPVWLTQFGDACRLASEYRRGRVLIAGDAAHVHFPAGGVGLNVGLQDALNLGWRLGMVARGEADDSLLDGYHQDRHPVGQALMVTTESQGELIRAFTPRQRTLRSLMSDLITRVPEMTHELAMRLSGHSVRYERGEGTHRVVGTSVPDVELSSSPNSTLFEQFDLPRFVALCREDVGPVALEGVRVVTASSPSLAKAGWADVAVALIRPDGYVLWATKSGDCRRATEDAATALADLLNGASECSRTSVNAVA